MAYIKNKIGNPCTDCTNIITTETVVYNQMGRVITRCTDCHKKHMTIRSTINKRLSKFGVTSAEFLEKKKLQLNGCAICKQPSLERELAIDHNHFTNQLRDLLCNKCNTVLGLVYENEDILINMIEYLKKHSRKIA